MLTRGGRAAEFFSTLHYGTRNKGFIYKVHSSTGSRLYQCRLVTNCHCALWEVMLFLSAEKKNSNWKDGLTSTAGIVSTYIKQSKLQEGH